MDPRIGQGSATRLHRVTPILRDPQRADLSGGPSPLYPTLSDQEGRKGGRDANLLNGREGSRDPTPLECWSEE